MTLVDRLSRWSETVSYGCCVDKYNLENDVHLFRSLLQDKDWDSELSHFDALVASTWDKCASGARFNGSSKPLGQKGVESLNFDSGSHVAASQELGINKHSWQTCPNNHVAASQEIGMNKHSRQTSCDSGSPASQELGMKKRYWGSCPNKHKCMQN